MTRRIMSVCSMLLVFTTLCLVAAPASSQELVREKLKSDVGIELLGKALLYSFGYQYTVSRQFGVEAGIGALGGGGGGDNTSVIFFPIGAKFYIVPKDGSLYVAGGIVPVTAHTDSGPFDDTNSASFFYMGLGFEYRAVGGLLFRGTAYGLINSEGEFFIWPGLTVGYAF